MIKIEELRPLYVLHSLAAVILAGTLALLGYELSKPKIQRVEASGPAFNTSALAISSPQPVITHRLPALSARFQRKVLFCSMHTKVAAGGQSGKAYIALHKSVPSQRSEYQ